MTPGDLKDRTKAFGLRVCRLVDALPAGRSSHTIGNQLIRSATSVGANYRAACRSRSTAEFLARLGVVEEEADESGYWLELLIDLGPLRPELLGPLLQEANELTAIIVASIRTAKQTPTRTRHPK